MTIKDFLEYIKNFFNISKSSDNITTSFLTYDEIVSNFINSDISKKTAQEFKRFAIQSLPLPDIEKVLHSSPFPIYEYPLDTKISPQNSINLTKIFFTLFPEPYSSQAISLLKNVNQSPKDEKSFTLIYRNGQDSFTDVKSRIVSCTQYGKGDLRDLYSLVHEITHTFDVPERNDNPARRIFGEIAPQCVERLLDDFLLNLISKHFSLDSISHEKLQELEITPKDFSALTEFSEAQDPNSLRKDIDIRKATTFISRGENLINFLKPSSNSKNTNSKEIDFRYVLAELYSASFMGIPASKRMSQLIEFIKNVKSGNLEFCKKSLGMDLSDPFISQSFKAIQSIKAPMNFLISSFYEKQEHDYVDYILSNTKGENFIQDINGLHVHIHLKGNPPLPYILIFPKDKEFKEPTSLVLESNNCEGKNGDASEHDLLLQGGRTSLSLNKAFKGNNPILIPLLPSVSGGVPYFQQLSQECFDNSHTPILEELFGKDANLDSILISVIDDAKKVLSQNGIKTNDKLLINGYSSSGVFAQRFCLLHPELVEKALIGGATSTIPMPSKDFDWPLGIKNYRELFGREFDFESYKNIIFKYYVADHEYSVNSANRGESGNEVAPMHDMTTLTRSVPTNVSKAFTQKLGLDPVSRSKAQVELLQKLGINFSLKEIPNTAHNLRDANICNKNSQKIQPLNWIKEIEDFFVHNLGREQNPEELEK